MKGSKVKTENTPQSTVQELQFELNAQSASLAEARQQAMDMHQAMQTQAQQMELMKTQLAAMQAAMAQAQNQKFIIQMIQTIPGINILIL